MVVGMVGFKVGLKLGKGVGGLVLAVGIEVPELAVVGLAVVGLAVVGLAVVGYGVVGNGVDITGTKLGSFTINTALLQTLVL